MIPHFVPDKIDLMNSFPLFQRQDEEEIMPVQLVQHVVPVQDLFQASDAESPGIGLLTMSRRDLLNGNGFHVTNLQYLVIMFRL